MRITIADSGHLTTRLAKILRKNFHVQAHLVNVRPGSSYMLRFEQVVKVVARLLDEIVTDNDVVGVMWGTTVSAVAQHPRPRNLSRITVVSLDGDANHRITGLPYVGSILQRFAVTFRGEERFLVLPAFSDNPGARTAMWVECPIRHTLQVRTSCAGAIFGVEGLGADLQSHVYSANHLDNSGLARLELEGVAGDVCAVMLWTDGSWRDLPINSRATGMTPAELRIIPRRICMVSRTGKAVPVLGVLRARVVMDLATDEKTARAVLHEMCPGLHFDQTLWTVDSRFWFGCAS